MHAPCPRPRRAKARLLTVVSQLGMPAAILPGSEPQRREADALIKQLRVRWLEQDGARREPEPGAWRLVYASNGTYVTRQLLPQALVGLGALPGFGLEVVRQDIMRPADGARYMCMHRFRVRV